MALTHIIYYYHSTKFIIEHSGESMLVIMNVCFKHRELQCYREE